MAYAVRMGNCAKCSFCQKFTRVKSDKRYMCCNFQSPAHKYGPFEHPEYWGCTYHFMPKDKS